jgi:hypothetical protein
MSSIFPLFTVLPGSTRVSEAVRMAHQQHAGLYLTRTGQVIIAPTGRAGWVHLPITTPEMAMRVAA